MFFAWCTWDYFFCVYCFPTAQIVCSATANCWVLSFPAACKFLVTAVDTLSAESCWSCDVEAEVLPGGLVLEEATAARGCLDLALYLINTGIQKLLINNVYFKFIVKEMLIKYIWKYWTILGTTNKKILAGDEQPHTPKLSPLYIVKVAFILF